MNQHNPRSIAGPLGAYSHAVSAPGAGRWLHIAGQIGLRADGTLAPDFVAQAEAAWSNLVAILADAGMGVEDLVKVTHYLVRGTDLVEYNPVRTRHLGEARPASTLIVVHALARPEWMIEIDAVAWKA
ncbi:MAG TPA: RidA family protein [Caldimonas sp.]|nr:RidA family protein [Caldimonas sp.]